MYTTGNRLFNFTFSILHSEDLSTNPCFQVHPSSHQASLLFRIFTTNSEKLWDVPHVAAEVVHHAAVKIMEPVVLVDATN
jgi:hypothetical protein